MDFAPTAAQLELQELTRQILAGKNASAAGDPADLTVWKELAAGDLVGLAIPEEYGGSGLGIFELATVLEELGRADASAPLLASIAMSALPISQLGTAEQKERWLAGVASGETILTAATEELGKIDPLSAATTATKRDGGWALNGTKIAVPWAPLADRFLVFATTGDGVVGVFVVEAGTSGVELSPGVSITGDPTASITLVDVQVDDQDVLGDPSTSDAAGILLETGLAGVLAESVGTLAHNLQQTADYTSQREVFGRPIASHQAAAMRLADSYIDMQAIRLTAWSAIWRVSEGRSATRELAIAKYWAADGGHRIVHASQHLHGGMGVDKDYGLYRSFLRAKELEMTLGGGSAHLLRVADLTLNKN